MASLVNQVFNVTYLKSLHLSQPRAKRSFLTTFSPGGEVVRREPRNIPEHSNLALEDHIRDVFRGSLLDQSVVGLEFEPPIPEYLPPVACPERVDVSGRWLTSRSHTHRLKPEALTS